MARGRSLYCNDVGLLLSSRAECVGWWWGPGGSPPNRVRLLVSGKGLASQCSPRLFRSAKRTTSGCACATADQHRAQTVVAGVRRRYVSGMDAPVHVQYTHVFAR